MKAQRGSIHRAVDTPDRLIRFYLFHGPDDAGSRVLAERLRAGLGAEKQVLSAAAIKADASLLSAEVGAISLFGETRLAWIEPAGDEICEAATALLNGPNVESPVVAIAGSLRKSSALLKLAEAHQLALAHASYVPEGRDAERMVVDMGMAEGLRLEPPLAARLAAACNGNRAVLAHELAKFALYLDAAPERPKALGSDVVDMLGADSGDGNMMRLGDLALSGRVENLFEELDRVALGAGEAIPVVRALQRRLLQLAGLRAQVEQGKSTDAVMTSMGKSLFWKDKGLMHHLLSNWSSERISAMLQRSAALEKQLFFSDEPPVEAIVEELVTIARAAHSRR